MHQQAVRLVEMTKAVDFKKKEKKKKQTTILISGEYLYSGLNGCQKKADSES